MFGNARRSTFSCTSASHLAFSNVHDAIEKCAVRENNGFGSNFSSDAGNYPYAFFTFDPDSCYGILAEIEVLGAFEHQSPFFSKKVAVILRSRTPHRRSFRTVQHSELDGTVIADDTGISTEGINFPDNLSFCNSSHGWIATHLSDHTHVHGDEKGSCAEVGCGRSSFIASVTCAYDDDVIFRNH